MNDKENFNRWILFASVNVGLTVLLIRRSSPSFNKRTRVVLGILDANDSDLSVPLLFSEIEGMLENSASQFLRFRPLFPFFLDEVSMYVLPLAIDALHRLHTWEIHRMDTLNCAAAPEMEFF